MKATEKGRRLHIEFGDPDDTEGGYELLVVPPADVQTGAALLADFIAVYVSAFDDADLDADPIARQVAQARAADAMNTADDMARRALGPGNYEKALTLRPAEFKDAVHAALFWNMQGGGGEALQAYVEGGRPKAVEVVFAAAGLQLKPQSTTSPSSESETPTQ